MNKALFKQLMLGRFRIGTDPTTAAHYVCESDACGTNGIDMRSWEHRDQPHLHRVHNRCTADRACSCECAMKRALSDLEMNIDIADGSTPDSASGAAMLAAVQRASYGELPFEVIQKFHHASHWASVHNDFDPMPEVADEVSLELHDGVGAPHGNANSSGVYMVEVVRLMRRWVLKQREPHLSQQSMTSLVMVFDILISILLNMHMRSDIESSAQLATALLSSPDRRCCGRSMGRALLMITKLEVLL